MKAMIVTLLLCAYMFSAMADTANCSDAAARARDIMQARQDGVPVETAYNAQPDEVGRVLVIAAYEHTRYETYAFQQSEVEDFTNKMFLACIKGAQ